MYFEKLEINEFEEIIFYIVCFEDIIFLYFEYSWSLSHWNILCTIRLKYVRARKGKV